MVVSGRQHRYANLSTRGLFKSQMPPLTADVNMLKITNNLKTLSALELLAMCQLTYLRDV